MIKAGSSVTWEYVSGKGMGGMGGIVMGGFGSLVMLEPGSALIITGNVGIFTSQVKETIPQEDGSVLVNTANSTYKVKAYK